MENEKIIQSKRLMILIILFIVIAIIAVGAYFLGAKTQAPQTVQPTPLAVTQPTITPDPTANWKKYTNKKCSYEMKYPPEWRLLPEPEEGIYGAAVIFPYEVGSGIKPPDSWFKLQIGCVDKGASGDSRNIVDQLNKRDSGYGVSKIEGLEKITLNGNLAYKQINVPPVGYSLLEYYIFPAGNKYYSLGFTPANNNSTVRDQILSTFKFTDQNQTASPDENELNNIAKILMTDYLDGFKNKSSSDQSKITDYQIESIKISKVISNINFSFGVYFSVKPIDINSWAAGNGSVDADGWIRHKYQSVVAVKENGQWKINGMGTGGE